MLAAGINIVPVSGKGNFINALSIARGFEIPFFAVFDADMNVDGKHKEDNIKLNRNILAMLGFDSHGKDGIIAENLWGQNFCAWKNSIQASFENAEEWEAEKVLLAAEFGWKLDRLTKNAMVLEAALERLHKKSTVVHLETLCSKILERFKTKTVELAQ
jgi:hypothetical protein